MINTELALADLDSVEKAIKRLGRVAKGGDKKAKAQIDLLESKLLPHLNEALPVRALKLNDDESTLIRELCLLTTKPTMYIANVAEDGFENNPHPVKPFSTELGLAIRGGGRPRSEPE